MPRGKYLSLPKKRKIKADRILFLLGDLLECLLKRFPALIRAAFLCGLDESLGLRTLVFRRFIFRLHIKYLENL